MIKDGAESLLAGNDFLNGVVQCDQELVALFEAKRDSCEVGFVELVDLVD